MLSLAPGGPILAEAVSLAPGLSDDAEADAARAMLDSHLSDLAQRIRALESSGAAIKITGDRLRVLSVAIRHANEHVAGYCDADETIIELGLTADAYREAVRELADLGAVTAHGNGNHASGYAGVSVDPAVFTELVGQVVPGVVAERELALLLDAFKRASREDWVPRDDFERLGIPAARAQHLLEYLEGQGLLSLDGPGTSVDRLLFLNAELLPRGRRVLRGDEPLPGA